MNASTPWSAAKTINIPPATLFLVAGGMFIVFAALHGVEAFMGRSAPKDIFGPAGFAFAFLGMLGMSSSLSETQSRLSRFGALIVVIGLAASAITSVWYVGLWVNPALPDYVSALALGMVLGQFLGYTSFGIASWRADVYPRTVGLLLVAVPSVLAVMIATVATGYATSGSAAVLGSVQAILHLAIGASLRTDGEPADRGEPSLEATAE
jgi:hypothetical protein